MTTIKVCGLTRTQDVNLAVELGVDCLGFILAESPRQISLKQAENLIKNIPPFISTAGVLVNPSSKKLQDILIANIFDYLQFHGEEEPEFLDTLPVKTIKAFSIACAKDLQGLSDYSHVDFFLFDTKVNSQIGGTGRKFNWDLLKNIEINKQFILAGGLGPHNLKEALNEVKPAAVDLNSQVENKPGIKNEKLLKKAVAQIRKQI